MVSSKAVLVLFFGAAAANLVPFFDYCYLDENEISGGTKGSSSLDLGCAYLGATFQSHDEILDEHYPANDDKVTWRFKMGNCGVAKLYCDVFYLDEGDYLLIKNAGGRVDKFVDDGDDIKNGEHMLIFQDFEAIFSAENGDGSSDDHGFRCHAYCFDYSRGNPSKPIKEPGTNLAYCGENNPGWVFITSHTKYTAEDYPSDSGKTEWHLDASYCPYGMGVVECLELDLNHRKNGQCRDTLCIKDEDGKKLPWNEDDYTDICEAFPDDTYSLFNDTATMVFKNNGNSAPGFVCVAHCKAALYGYGPYCALVIIQVFSSDGYSPLNDAEVVLIPPVGPPQYGTTGKDGLAQFYVESPLYKKGGGDDRKGSGYYFYAKDPTGYHLENGHYVYFESPSFGFGYVVLQKLVMAHLRAVDAVTGEGVPGARIDIFDTPAFMRGGKRGPPPGKGKPCEESGVGRRGGPPEELAFADCTDENGYAKLVFPHNETDYLVVRARHPYHLSVEHIGVGVDVELCDIYGDCAISMAPTEPFFLDVCVEDVDDNPVPGARVTVTDEDGVYYTGADGTVDIELMTRRMSSYYVTVEAHVEGELYGWEIGVEVPYDFKKNYAKVEITAYPLINVTVEVVEEDSGFGRNLIDAEADRSVSYIPVPGAVVTLDDVIVAPEHDGEEHITDEDGLVNILVPLVTGGDAGTAWASKRGYVQAGVSNDGAFSFSDGATGADSMVVLTRVCDDLYAVDVTSVMYVAETADSAPGLQLTQVYFGGLPSPCTQNDVTPCDASLTTVFQASGDLEETGTLFSTFDGYLYIEVLNSDLEHDDHSDDHVEISLGQTTQEVLDIPPLHTGDSSADQWAVGCVDMRSQPFQFYCVNLLNVDEDPCPAILPLS